MTRPTVSDFGNGVSFAMLVYKHLGSTITTDQFFDLVEKLATGQEEIDGPSPEEFIADMEAKNGPMPDVLKQSTYRLLSEEAKKSSRENIKELARAFLAGH